MKLLRGLNTDCSEVDQPEGTYRYAKNIIDSNVLNAKENEDGFINCGALTPYTLIGVVPTGTSFVVFSTNNTDSEIGEITRTGTSLNYTMIYNDPDLAFNTANPIQGEYRLDVNRQRVVAWTDNLNTPRILNIDDPSSVNDIEDLAIFQRASNPSISSSSISDSGGALTTGAKILITRYKNADGSTTNWFVHDHVFYINDDPKSGGYLTNDGCDGGVITSKLISINLADCDTNYDTLVVGVIESKNQIITATELFEVTNNTTLAITITGNETRTDLSLDEVLTGNTNYLTAETITQLRGQLWFGNLTTDELPALQQAALDIKIDYVSTLTTITSNTGVHKDNLPPTFTPGEVYAFYLGVELIGGGWAFYHIPGRPNVTGETQLINDVTNNLTYYKFQVDNTSNNGLAATNMGYWENQTELYPNTSEFNGSIDLRNQKVRHHRMPTLDYLRSVSVDPLFGVSKLPILTINVTNVVIPAPLQSKIRRWKIFFAKKSQSNSLVIGDDLLQFGADRATGSVNDTGSGGNWHTNYFTGVSTLPIHTLDKNILRGHSLDLFFNNTGITPTYTRFNYHLRRSNFNGGYIHTSSAGGSDGCTLTTSASNGNPERVVIDYTNVVQCVSTATSFIKRLDNFTYLPTESIVGTFSTQNTERCFSANIFNIGTSFNSVVPGTITFNAGTGNSQNFEDSMHFQYYQILNNVHNSFFTQNVIPLEGYASPSTTSLSNVSGGDTFACFLSFLTYAAGTLTLVQNTVQAFRGYIGYSRYNFNYRQEELGNVGSLFYGKSNPGTTIFPFLTPQSNTTPFNIVEYNEDFNRLNEFMVGTIFNSSNPSETEFPHTVVWSDVQQEDSKEFSWRSFPAGNRYVIPKNKGEIVNLQGWANRNLLIHTEHSLFRTRTDATMATDTATAYLKSGATFDIPPEELVSTESGYGGTQNKFGCTLTKVGYAFVDDLQGKVFLYDGEQLQEISTNGMRQFFRDLTKILTDNNDNPFTSNGYTIAFDERVNRLLVTKNYGSLSWTISYNPTTRTWTSFHDYIPDYMWVTVDSILYGLKDNVIFIQNIPTSTAKGTFYDGLVKSSFIDVVHNLPAYIPKVYTTLEWITESYPNSYTNGVPDLTLDYNNTLTHITVRTQDQCTGRTVLTRQSGLDLIYNANTRKLTNSWLFDEIRDIATQPGFTLGFYQDYNLDLTKLNINLDWHDKRKIKDKFVICRYEYDNVINKRLLLLETEATTRHAER